MAFDLQAVIEPEIEILTSRDLSRKVIDALGVKSLYPEILKGDELTMSPLEAELINFSGNLSVTRPRKSNVIHVFVQIPYLIFSPLGIYFCTRHGYFKQMAPIFIFAAYFYSIHLPTIALARYSVPLLPFLAIFPESRSMKCE